MLRPVFKAIGSSESVPSKYSGFYMASLADSCVASEASEASI